MAVVGASVRDRHLIKRNNGEVMTQWTLIALAIWLTIPIGVQAQGRGGRGAGGGQPTASPQAAAPIDLSGYWVSLVTDNWTYRVITPPKGDYLYLPLNPEARRVADTWDPAKDEAAGEQCKGYGPVGVMRMPTRLHITWQDANTLKLETDTGTQTRLFHFGQARVLGKGIQSPNGNSPVAAAAEAGKAATARNRGL